MLTIMSFPVSLDVVTNNIQPGPR